MSIVVAFNPVEYQDKRREKAQENAILALSMAPSYIYPIAFGFLGDKPHPLVKYLNITTLNILKNDSGKILGNDRRLPYINEIFDNCCKIDCDMFGYINSDILLNNDFYRLLGMPYDAYIFSRFEVAEFDQLELFVSGKFLPKTIFGGDKHCGNDAFFFWREWYLDNKDVFDKYQLVLGETEWDTCFRYLIKKLTLHYFEFRTLYHVYHKQIWNVSSKGAINNICVLEKVKEALSKT